MSNRQDLVTPTGNIPPNMPKWSPKRSILAAVIRALICALLMFNATIVQALQGTLTASAVDGGLQPIIKGSCDLPDAMVLIVRVTRKESAFQYESRVEVQGGHFQIGPLMQGSGNLNSGIYNLEVVSVPMPEQPDSVKKSVGGKGKDLRGPLATRSSGDPGVRLLTTLEIGGPANADLDTIRREQVRLSETRWWRNKCRDICGG